MLKSNLRQSFIETEKVNVRGEKTFEVGTENLDLRIQGRGRKVHEL